MEKSVIKSIINRYMEERKTREIEKYIVEAMYQASSISGYTSFENILRIMAESDYGVLSSEFRKAYNCVRTGESVESALEKMSNRSMSPILKRAVSILVNGYRTGIDLSSALREAAEDVEKTLEIERENRAAITVEKYTILFAGGIIVPLILGTMISLVSGLNLSSLSELGLGAQNEGVIANSILGNQIYVIVYSIMASFFVAYQEKKIENSLLYMVFLLPASVFLFNLAQCSNLLSMV